MIELTDYSCYGGCGSKISPVKLQEILQQIPLNLPSELLLVGTETNDDAAVYQLNDNQALVLTTDFFTPIVNNPIDFGRIAATNALSDIYAMGATPILALSVLGMPVNMIPMEVIQDIMKGGVLCCQEAGIPLAGGHSIISSEPIFGLVAVGLVNPMQVKRNSTAKPNDKIILTKPLGIGIMTTALNKGQLSSNDYIDLLKIMTQLNRIGTTLAANPNVHAMTDVTGFGLLGHLLEICKGSQLMAKIKQDLIPILTTAKTLASQNIFLGGARRNWDDYQDQIKLKDSANEQENLLLADPQTSGGLLLAVSSESAPFILDQLKAEGYNFSNVIGEFSDEQKGTIELN